MFMQGTLRQPTYHDLSENGIRDDGSNWTSGQEEREYGQKTDEKAPPGAGAAPW